MDIRKLLNGKQMMGARLKYYRETAGLSVVDLEKRTKIRRSHIYNIEEGTANFSIDLYEKLLKACNGVTLMDCLLSLRDPSSTPADVEDLYEMLDVIVAGQIPRQIDGIRVSLEGVTLNVQRLRGPVSSLPDPPKAGPGRSQGKTRS